MKKRIIQFTSLALVLISLASFENASTWIKAGSDIQKYEMGEKVPSNHEGIGVVTIKSKSNNETGYGVLMHKLDASTYAGKRIRISGLIKTDNVSQWCGFWINANQPVSSQNINLADIKHSSLKGNLKSYVYSSVTVDVPSGSSGIAYGPILKGSGQVWAGRVTFDIVDKSVPLTNN